MSAMLGTNPRLPSLDAVLMLSSLSSARSPPVSCAAFLQRGAALAASAWVCVPDFSACLFVCGWAWIMIAVYTPNIMIAFSETALSSVSASANPRASALNSARRG